jgi:hypothetical protein
VAEVSAAGILTTANRYRLNADATRLRDDDRQAREIATDNRAAEVAQQKLISEEATKRAAQSIRDRRNNIESQLAQQLKLKGQQQVLDAVDGDTRYRVIRDDITLELNAARDNEAEALARIESELAEALALDADDEFRADLASRPDFQGFLGERSQRQTLRQQQARDFQVQQRIDLRLADDNIRSINPGEDLARGSIVDVSG